MNIFKLEVLNPEEKIFDGDARSLTARALDGELGILPNHAPLLTVLDKGNIRVNPKDSSEFKIEISSGILKVNDNLVQVFLS
jgi:F-type H+-transporting ATPase subunit epsilon